MIFFIKLCVTKVSDETLNLTLTLEEQDLCPKLCMPELTCYCKYVEQHIMFSRNY